MEEKVLEREYDSVFEDDERILNLLKIDKDAYTRYPDRVKVSEIGLSEPSKIGRKETRIGLTKTIRELGVVSPIHVMTAEVPDVPEELLGEIEVPKYILIDGLRRLYGARRNNMEEVDVIVWDFKDKELGRSVALIIGLLLSKTQRRSWQEAWDLMQILEQQSESIMTPGTIETLLDLEPGDSMKLKDVMLSGDEEAIGELISGNKTLQQCYNLLQKHRKDEDRLEKEDNTGISSMGDVEGIAEEEARPMLSNEEVSELLEMSDDMMENLEESDFEDINKSVYQDEYQKVGERHPVDPQIRQNTFIRDDFKCRCCDTGGAAFLSTLRYHHAVPVHCGGPDTVENGLTLCDSCHQTLHVAEKNGGKLPMTKEQYDSYNEETKMRIKKIRAYAMIAVKAAQKKGISREQVVKEANASMRPHMPGDELKVTTAGFNAYNSMKKEA